MKQCDEQLAKQIGARIRQHRIRLGYNQVEIGHKLDVRSSSVCYWEHGHHIPSIQFVRDLCQIFDVSVDYLLGFTEETR